MGRVPMAARRFLPILLAILLLGGVPWSSPATANHLPTPPYPCHPRGCTEWERVESPGSYEELRASLEDLAHDRLYAVGRGIGYDLFVMAFDARDGGLAYRVNWTPASGQPIFPNAAALSPDGATLVVTGSIGTVSNDTNRGPDLLVVAFDAATGNERWSSSFDTNGSDDEGFAVAVDGARVYALGRSISPDDTCYVGYQSFQDRVDAVAFDLGTGMKEWSVRDTTWRAYGAVGSRIIIGADGGVHLAETVHSCSATMPGGAAQYATLLWTVDPSTGGTVWERSFVSGSAADNWMQSFVAQPSGARLFLGGWGNVPSQPGVSVGTLAAFDAGNGATLWSDVVPTEGDGSVVHALAVSPDGAKLLVASSDHTPGSWSSTRVQMRDADSGTLQWSGVQRPLWDGEPTAAAFSTDGSRAYVSGAGGATTFTASLDPATGAKVWDYVVPVVDSQYHGPPKGIYPTPEGLHVLSIAPTQNSMTGDRSIVARSAAVIAPPERPDALATPAGVRLIRVSWTPPTDDGGRPITQYVISRSATFQGTYATIGQVNGTTRSLDDPGRDAGVYYFYIVAAVNDVGLGAPSQIVAAKASDLPGPPRNVHASPGPSPLVISTVVTWQRPLNDGGAPIAGYVIVRNEPSGDITPVGQVGAGVLTFEDKGTRLAAPYAYSVSAFTTVGEGPAATSGCTRASPVGIVTTLVAQPCILSEELSGVEPALPR